MNFEDEFWEDEPEGAPELRDPAVVAACEAIRNVYESMPESVFYVRQLEVMLEKRFFHWVTDFAIRDLSNSGFLATEYVELRQSKARLRFLFRPGHRFRKRQIKRTVDLVRQYSEPQFAKACGLYAQTLFLHALLKRGFQLEAENARSHGGRTWTETEQDLDFIIGRDNVMYGCEVKNRLEYISREELTAKLRMCELLGLRPMFIMRASPKTYNFSILQNGGYAWIYEAQVYPPGHESLAERVREGLGLPVMCSYAIPSGMVDRFLNWHRRA
jgi:hypothetical protein